MQEIVLLLPLLLIILTGLASVKLKLVQKDAYIYLNKVVIFIAMPALTISSLLTMNKDEIGKFPEFVLVNIIACITFALVLFFILTRTKMKFETFGAVYNGVMEYNVVYFGFPIILGLFGPIHFAYAVVWVAVVLQILSTLNAFLLTVKSGQQFSVQKTLRDLVHNPFIISTFIGFFAFAVVQIFPRNISPEILNITDQMGGIILTVLTRIGGLASTLALFSLGVFMSSNFKINSIRVSLMTSVLKLLILPLWMLVFACYIFPLSREAAETTVLLAAMPTAVYAVIVSDFYKYDKNQVTNTLFLSSVLFLITLPLWIWILSLLK